MSDCEGLGTGCEAGGWHNQHLSYMFDFFKCLKFGSIFL